MEVTAQMVKDLRGRTGAGIMDCKEALREKSGDLEEAIRYLREKGLSSAARKAGREASEGLVAARVDSDGRAGAMVEVNCETDFVAKTEDFQSLVERTLSHVAENGPETLGAESVQEGVTAAIAKLGENIIASRAERYAVPGGRAGRVAAYVHPGGRIGVLVEVACASEETAAAPAVAELAKDLAMHVAASNPDFLRPEAIPESVLENEREILRAQQKDAGKPDHIVEKIVEGRVAKFVKESCLLEQPFIKDPDQPVKAMLAARAKEIGEEVSVSRFVRFQLGERSG